MRARKISLLKAHDIIAALCMEIGEKKGGNFDTGIMFLTHFTCHLFYEEFLASCKFLSFLFLVCTPYNDNTNSYNDRGHKLSLYVLESIFLKKRNLFRLKENKIHYCYLRIFGCEPRPLPARRFIDHILYYLVDSTFMFWIHVNDCASVIVYRSNNVV